MKKFAAALAATALAVLGLVAPGSSAFAADSPYPPTVCDVQITPSPVQSGQAFTVSVTADQPSVIKVTFNGVTKSSAPTATSFSAQFTAPRTQSNRTYPISVMCGPTDGSVDGVSVIGDGTGTDGDSDADGGSDADTDGGVNADAGNTDAAADADSDAGDANGILPGTGGTDFWLLVLGALLVIAGVGTVVARRRRS